MGDVLGVKSSYQSILGMMNEDLDWFFTQITAMREEFKEDMSGVGG